MKFLISKIKGDGYDRIAYLEEQNSTVKLWVHFIQFNEYVEASKDIIQNTIGSIIEGELKIDLVMKYELNNIQIECGFNQPIIESSHIIACGIVTHIEDECTIRCNIKGLSTDIVVEFENDIEIHVGDRIQLKGSLELEME